MMVSMRLFDHLPIEVFFQVATCGVLGPIDLLRLSQTSKSTSCFLFLETEMYDVLMSGDRYSPELAG